MFSFSHFTLSAGFFCSEVTLGTASIVAFKRSSIFSNLKKILIPLVKFHFFRQQPFKNFLKVQLRRHRRRCPFDFHTRCIVDLRCSESVRNAVRIHGVDRVANCWIDRFNGFVEWIVKRFARTVRRLLLLCEFLHAGGRASSIAKLFQQAAHAGQIVGETREKWRRRSETKKNVF